MNKDIIDIKDINDYHEYYDYDQLIERIKRFGINVQSTDTLKEHLMSFNYFNYVNVYKDTIIKNKDNGLTEQDIFLLYTIDFNFQMILFKYILFFEQSFRERINIILCEDFGHLEFNYLNPSKYYKRSATENILNKILVDLKYKQNPLKYYIEQKLNVPPWIFLKQLDFGNLTLLYEQLKSNQKERIINYYYSYDTSTEIEEKKNFFKLSLEYIRNYRNAIAHSNNINKLDYETKYSYNVFSKLIHPDIVSHPEFRYKIGNGDTYGLIIILLTHIRSNVLRHSFSNEIISFLESIYHLDSNRSSLHYNLFIDIVKLPPYLENKLNRLLDKTK